MRKCSAMPYHIGIVLKLYLSRRGKHIVAVNDGAARAVYNRLVASGNEIYRMQKAAVLVPVYRERIDFLQASYYTPAGIKNALPFLYEKDVDCQAVANSIQNYHNAWKNMRERHTGVPAFHKKGCEQSYQTNGHYVSGSAGLSDGTVRFPDASHILLPKLGRVRFDGSPKLIHDLLVHDADTRIGTVTIRRDAVGEYWCSLQISSETPFREELARTGSSCGIDLNLLDLVNMSDGGSYENGRFYRKSEKWIAKLERTVCRRREAAKRDGRRLEDSKNYQKARQRLAYELRKVARQRADHLGVISKQLVESQDLIAAEDLKVRNMLKMKNHHFAKSIADAGWRSLLTKLRQKGAMYGKTVVLVPPQYTTQTCSVCGHVMKGREALPLSARDWTCPACGTYHVRDVNAARNILDKALKTLQDA